MNSQYNVRVQYEPQTIKYLAVQCPCCEKWFRSHDIVCSSKQPVYCHDIGNSSYLCPVCGESFGLGTDCFRESITETSYPAIYKECLTKKVTWE